MGDEEQDDEPVCGFSFDHDEGTTYDGPDGYGWECRRCGAEGWEDAAPIPSEEAPSDA